MLVNVLGQHTPDKVLAKSMYPFYFLAQHELFEADAHCDSYSYYEGTYISSITSNEGCEKETRAYGASLFLSCVTYTLSCYVYANTRSIDTCNTANNTNNCYIYRVKYNSGKK